MRSNPILLIIAITIGGFYLKIASQLWLEARGESLFSLAFAAFVLWIFFIWINFLPFWAVSASIALAPLALLIYSYLISK
jgi:hypothetical protein